MSAAALTNRDRFRRLLQGESIDRLPVMALEPFEADALQRWHAEGLPAGTDPVSFLGMSRLVNVPLCMERVPAYVPDIVAEDATSFTQRDSMGSLVRRQRSNPTMFYGHVDHPVKSRDDWREYRKRFQPCLAARLDKDWPALGERLRMSTEPVWINLFPFFFRFGFYSMGMARFLMAFYDDPDMIHEMFDTVGRMTFACLERILETVVPDVVTINEDLAGKNNPLVSPEMYAQFWDPHQNAVLRLLRDHGVQVICMWSAGKLDPLIPALLDRGITCTWPLEVMAGMDAPALRQRYGARLALGGNIAKEAVIAGPAAIDGEIDRLLPLIHAGRFLPALDDMASPDMPFAHYRQMIERLQTVKLG
jgi:hypothetical protein